MMPNVLDLINFHSIFLFIKRAFLVVFSFIMVLSLFYYFATSDKPKLTAEQIYNPKRTEMYRKLSDPNLTKTKTDKLLVSSYKKFSCALIGELCTDNPDEAYRYQKNSLIGKFSQLIALPYVNPPASGIYWTYDSLQNVGFVPKTYAAEGIGFAAIKPIINLWKVFRNISYLIIVLVFMVVGFMIMFRMKLNPQTVISIENALPKIVVSLILITFSFAIAGFLIDLMYVVIAVAISLISDNGANFNVGEMQKMYLDGNGLALWEGIFANPASGKGMGILNLMEIGTSIMINVLSAIPMWLSMIIYSTLNFVIGFLMFRLIESILGKPFGTPANDVEGGALTVLVGLGDAPQLITWPLVIGISLYLGFMFGPFILIILLGLLIFFTLLFLYFRIFFLLFKSYLQILILIILSPVILLVEAVPGKSTFSYWLKNLMAEIMSFPIVITILTIGFVISKQLASAAYHTSPSGSPVFWRPPFMNVIDPSVLPILVGIGFILLTPDLVKLAKEQVFGVKGLPINLGIGTFFGGAAAAGGGGIGLVSQVSSLSLGLQALTGKSIGNILGTAPNPNTTQPAPKPGEETRTGGKPK